MKTRRIAISLLIVLFLAGCGGAKYAEEKALLSTVTKAMETFTSSVSSAETPDAMAGLLGTFSGQIEKAMPKLKELSEAHPDWENEPPKELKDAMDKFKAVGENFKNEAMPKLMQMAAQHGDNETLQNAIQKLSGLMMGM